MITKDEKKLYAVLGCVLIVVSITCIGAVSGYNKCEAEGGEFIRGWFFGPRCLIVEREIEL